MKPQDRITPQVNVQIVYDYDQEVLTYQFPDQQSAEGFVNTLAPILGEDPAVTYMAALKPVAFPLYMLNILYDIHEEKILVFAYQNAAVVCDPRNKLFLHLERANPNINFIGIPNRVSTGFGMTLYYRALEWPVMQYAIPFCAPFELAHPWVMSVVEFISVSLSFVAQSRESCWFYERTDRGFDEAQIKELRETYETFNSFNLMPYFRSWTLDRGYDLVEILKPYHQFQELAAFNPPHGHDLAQLQAQAVLGDLQVVFVADDANEQQETAENI